MLERLAADFIYYGPVPSNDANLAGSQETHSRCLKLVLDASWTLSDSRRSAPDFILLHLSK